MDIENRLIQGNKKYMSNSSISEVRTSLVDGQHPFALIITCSDSRVVPEQIFDCSLGELFVIRTAGNVINEGELATVEYAIEHLHVKYVLILAHTHCGAVHAAIEDEKGQYLSPILDNIKSAINGERNERLASMKNATKQSMYLKEKFPHYDGQIKTALYDIESGEVIF